MRGYGLELDLQFTKDGEIVMLHDATLSRFSGGKDTRTIADLTRQEITDLSFDGCRIADFDQVCALFLRLRASGLNTDSIIALHFKGWLQKVGRVHMDALLRKICTCHIPTSDVVVFDVLPQSAAYLKLRQPDLQLAASVAHPFDVQRYNACVNGTLLTVDEIIALRSVYDWAWLDEWDLADSAGGEKRFYTQETFACLRENGFKVALVTPELHASSPGLLGGESHRDGIDQERLRRRFQEIVDLYPDLICTDYPDTVQVLATAAGSRLRV